MDAVQPARRRALVIAGLMLGGVCTANLAAANPGGGPTGCIHLCPAVWTTYQQYGTIAPCVVGIGVSSTAPYDRDVAVTPGSTIDCRPLEVRVNQYDLTVTDGGFLLLAGKVLVSGSGNRIAALCQSAYDKHGFRIVASDDIDVASSGELVATCTQGGGLIELRSDGDITLGGAAVAANAQYGPGGEVVVRADGNVTVSSAIEAKNSGTSGYYPGGAVVVEGHDVLVQGGLVATGTNNDGGRIHVDASGTLTVNTAGTVDASGTQTADGGEVKLEAVEALVTSRPVKAKGNGSTSYGGDISLTGEAVDVDNELTASGGAGGGSIEVESRGGALRIANAASSPIKLDVTRASNNPGDGGTIDVRSLGGDVTLTAYADLDASGSGSGDGGEIEVAGAAITAATGSTVQADASSSGEGGNVVVRARGALTLSGGVTASNGGYVTILHRDASPSTGGVTCPSSTCELTRDQYMPAPCGDGIRRAGVEQCDGGDLGGATCQSIGGGYTGGTLTCSSTCAFDTSGCTS